jgi:predicted flap endonuclease-1-like 5' DNA nuclease
MWPICNVGGLSSFLWLLLPLLLGLLTGWWIWANRPRLAVDSYAAPRETNIGLGGAIAGAGAVAAGAGAAVAKSADVVVGAGKATVNAGATGVGGAAALAAGAGAAAIGAGSSLLDKGSDTVKAAASTTAGVGAGAAVIAAGGAGLALTAIGIPAAVGAADDLLLIKGVGPKLNDVLNGLGITRFDQIAAWSRDDVSKVDGHLESFSGRIDREEWIPQAKLLAIGNMTEFNRLYGAVGAAAGVTAAGAIAMTALGIPAAVGAPDDLLQLKGVGPKLNTLLTGLGITRFDQIGAWTADDVAKVDAELGSFKGRIERESWIEQAGLLATGSIATFEAKFGKLDSENS